MERKRHLGNDIAVIIYIESQDDEYPMGAALSFDPSKIKSKFNRILKLKFYVTCTRTYNPHMHAHAHTHNTHWYVILI